jgi:cell division protein FtsB
MISFKKVFPFFVIIILVVIIKNNISSILASIDNVYTTKNLANQLKIEQKEQKFLQERLKYVSSEQFIEEQAKEKLGLLKEGEFFVIAPTSVPPNSNPAPSIDYPNWKKWLDLFF